MLKLITYDLRAPGRNYPAVYEKIKSFGPTIKILESTWLVRSDISCIAIRNALLPVGDVNDGFFVALLTDTAWNNLTIGNDAAGKFIRG